MPIPEQISDALLNGGALNELRRPSTKDISDVLRHYPEMSRQYLEFVSVAGVGMFCGINICLPYLLLDLVSRNTNGMELTKSYRQVRAMFGGPLEIELAPIDRDVVIIAESGGSWYYCMRSLDDPAVYTYDLAIGEMELTAPDFFTFIESHIDSDAS